MADKKVSELSAITNLSGDDLLLVVNDPSGTPQSNKVTLTNLFANVVPSTTFKKIVNHKGNTTFTGTTMTVSSNATYSGTLTVTGTLVESGTTTRSGVFINTGNTIINGKTTANGALNFTGTLQSDGTVVISTNGKIHANNAISNDTITPAMLQEVPASNTNFQSALANTNLAIADRLQVSNATAQFANSDSTILTGTARAVTILANVVSVTANTGLRVSGGGLTGQVPATSNAVTEGIPSGTIWYSNNHLYIAVDGNTIKRVNLSTF